MNIGPLKHSLCCPRCRGDLTWNPLPGCATCRVDFDYTAGVISFEQAREIDDSPLEITVLILARNEGANLRRLLPELFDVLRGLDVSYELRVVDGNSNDDTIAVCQQFGALVHRQQQPGYGNAFREGVALCRGRYIITVDADFSHDPHLVTLLWQQREAGELVVASRYGPRGEAWMDRNRLILSQILNRGLRTMLSLPALDLSSGYRLYRRRALQQVTLQGRDFDVLIEALVKLVMAGHRVVEIPLLYKPRREGVSKAQLVRFAKSYLSSTWRLWRTRNSIDAADYDDRAYHSIIYPQRYWQRKRYEIIMRFLGGDISSILDVGCGSSKIIQSLPGAVACDVSLKKLRFLRQTNPWLVHGSVFQLPFRDESFSTVVCSQVIEHIPNTEGAVGELLRVLKPGGRLILGTPDYGTWKWPLIERIYERVIPGGYADEHITHLTRGGTIEMVKKMGCDFLEDDAILDAEWVGLFRKHEK